MTDGQWSVVSGQEEGKMSDELKPAHCGCGGEAEVRGFENLDDSVSIYICCTKCHTSTVSFTGDQAEANAVEVWNQAMGAKDINVPAKERTAKVIEHDASITDDRGYKYLRTEYLCGKCKKKVIGGDEYCSHCGARLEWK